MTESRRPPGLGAKGAAFWRKIIASYELAPHEEVVLEGACRELDLIAKIEVELKTASFVVKGSRGQDAASPLLAELRLHRAAFLSMVKAMRLPPLLEDQGRSPRSRQAQAAARARWGMNS